VTLPSKWRQRIQSNTVVFIERDNILEIHPAEVITGEEVLFDAVRDNNGKGIPVEDLIEALEKDTAR